MKSLKQFLKKKFTLSMNAFFVAFFFNVSFDVFIFSSWTNDSSLIVIETLRDWTGGWESKSKLTIHVDSFECVCVCGLFFDFDLMLLRCYFTAISNYGAIMNNKLYNSNTTTTKNPKALKNTKHIVTCVCVCMHVKMKEPFSYSTEVWICLRFSCVCIFSWNVCVLVCEC